MKEKAIPQPSLQEQLEVRLGELRAEYISGETHVATHQNALAQLNTKMPRISGAIQALEEVLGLRERVE